jgi:hypothetical protein
MVVVLKGWTLKPLPTWIELAILKGDITIHTTVDKKYGEYDYLKGKAINPYGLVIEFQ